MTDPYENYYKKILSEEEYHCLRMRGTEQPFSGKYYDFFEQGRYSCKACHSPLFSSDDKFRSSCGWPSFSKPLLTNSIVTKEDFSHNMHREEVLCAHCLSHLGHVFRDDPSSNKLRYCINSICLIFEPKK
jgi:peptide-methionine (R)-S-oxide reductase